MLAAASSTEHPGVLARCSSCLGLGLVWRLLIALGFAFTRHRTFGIGSTGEVVAPPIFPPHRREVVFDDLWES